MIFRALFWIAVVAVFIPSEPNIGLGRPNAIALPPQITALLAATFKVPPCDERAQCVAGLSIASDFRHAVRERLEQAKADLKTSSPLARSGLPH